jgi:hypothetical protein
MPFNEPTLPKPPEPDPLPMALTAQQAKRWFAELKSGSPYLDYLRFVPGGPCLVVLKRPVRVSGEGGMLAVAATITKPGGSVWWYDTLSEAEAAYHHDVDLMDGIEPEDQ